jgi:hypothetical protein
MSEHRDPLTRALEETPDVREEPRRSDVIERKVPSHPVGEVLDELQSAAVQAVSSPVFDDAPKVETTPIVKRAGVEASGLRVRAHRNDPPLEAEVAIEVRRDQVKSDTDVYQVRARGRVSSPQVERSVEQEFPVPLDLREEDGHVELDANEVHDRMASAVRSTRREATPSPRGSRSAG